MTLTPDNAHQVTARRYRPQTFDAVVSQAHVTRTLRNALSSGRMAQAYLFSGPRGVGKTTLARLLAKGLHCEKGPTGDPCGVCEGCRAITESRCLDYQEIDGASNRGIDQIRELNASLGFASPNQKHRVFVIDEVHMLTLEAFNALLKSLEEPPPKVVFIFCTTESHKVPLTIRSRCQQYVFRAFAMDEIRGQLTAIIDAEGATAEDEALFLIARAARGSMRDSQSLLDQVLSYSGKVVTAAATREVLGLASGDGPITFLKGLQAGDLAGCRETVYGVMASGQEGRAFFLEVVRFLNALVFMKNGITDPVRLEIPPQDAQGLSALAPGFELEELFTLLERCHELLRDLKRAADEHVWLDSHLITILRYKDLVSAGQFKAALRQLSEGGGGMGMTASHPGPAATDGPGMSRAPRAMGFQPPTAGISHPTETAHQAQPSGHTAAPRPVSPGASHASAVTGSSDPSLQPRPFPPKPMGFRPPAPGLVSKAGTPAGGQGPAPVPPLPQKAPVAAATPISPVEVKKNPVLPEMAADGKTLPESVAKAVKLFEGRILPDEES